MKFIAVALIALAFTAGAQASREISGTLALDTPAPYAFGDEVTFTVTTQNLKGNQYPMVYVACRSVVDNELLYGQLAHPYETFILGGGSSEWHADRDDANCTADVRVYGTKNDQGQVVLDSVAFFAEG